MVVPDQGIRVPVPSHIRKRMELQCSLFITSAVLVRYWIQDLAANEWVFTHPNKLSAGVAIGRIGMEYNITKLETVGDKGFWIRYDRYWVYDTQKEVFISNPGHIAHDPYAVGAGAERALAFELLKEVI